VAAEANHARMPLFATSIFAKYAIGQIRKPLSETNDSTIFLREGILPMPMLSTFGIFISQSLHELRRQLLVAGSLFHSESLMKLWLYVRYSK
jgi:hypothetical protein